MANQDARPDETEANDVSAGPADVAPTVEEPAVEEASVDPVELLRQERDELNDKYLRAVAESRNIQQRAQRDKQESLRYAEADFARDLMIVLDDLNRTIESAADATDPAAVVAGVKLVHDNFLKVLRQRHIEEIEAVGQPFDPDVHEALLHQPSDEVPAGTVLQEIARGYRMHDRVIRSARVVVSSGPASDAQ